MLLKCCAKRAQRSRCSEASYEAAILSTMIICIFAGTQDIAQYDNGTALGSPSREYMYAGGESGVRTPVQSTEQGHFPYDEVWYTTSTTTKFIFTTYERDSESGLDYAMARFYISRFGRFCSADPVEGEPDDPQSWNRYAYVRNDPVNLTDPSGLFWGFLLKLFKVITPSHQDRRTLR